MHHRQIRLFAIALAILAGIAGRSWGDERPNIVLILLDDVGYSDYGCFGGEIETPHIDQLAREGLRFTQFYNNAFCVPTRASLLTGLYPRYASPNAGIQLTPSMITIGELLQSAGYQTSLSGKWHLGRTSPNRPIDRGFADFFGMLDGCSNHFDPNIPDPPFEGGRVRMWARNGDRVTKFPPGFYSSDAVADHAIENIRRFAAAGRPFLAHICFTAGHSPLHAKPADIARYRGKYTVGWDEIRRRRRERQIALGIVDPAWSATAREPEFPAWEQEPLREWNADLMAVYAAMIDCIDQSIGRVLQALREAGVERDTLVLVLNDNGGCAEQAGGSDPGNIAGPKTGYVSCGAGWASAQNTPFRRYKGWVHEGGIATPLIARWPAVTPAGGMTRQVGHVVDLLPTLADATNARYPAERNGRPLLPVEGLSLLPLLRANAEQVATTLFERDNLYWKAFGNRAVRQGKWKLVRDQSVRTWELYDMEADRTETRDLAGQFPNRVRELSAAWDAWAQTTGADRESESIYTLIRIPKSLPPIKIALIGDSTVASYAKPPPDRPDLTGWGQVFGAFFQEPVTVINRAQSGRSSKSFFREGRWEPVLAERPDYVFIQFGHNDQPGKGDRTTDPNDDFLDNLRKYIDDSRAVGAQPILVTPVARRTFSAGQLQTTLTPYADAMQKVAQEKQVPLVDLHGLSLQRFAELGDEGSSYFSASAGDRTHFSRRGALEIARLVAYSLPLSVPSLRLYLRQPWQVPQAE